jgi:hypothetical protein
MHPTNKQWQGRQAEAQKHDAPGLFDTMDIRADDP